MAFGFRKKHRQDRNWRVVGFVVGGQKQLCASQCFYIGEISLASGWVRKTIGETENETAAHEICNESLGSDP